MRGWYFLRSLLRTADFLLSYGPLLVVCICCWKFVDPRNPKCVMQEGAYAYSFDSAVGKVTVLDLKNLLRIECKNFAFKKVVSGALLVNFTARSVSFKGKCKGVDVDCVIGKRDDLLVQVAFAESRASRQFKGKYVATNEQGKLHFKCKRADPGIEDLVLSVDGVGRMLGGFSGKFYKREFRGDIAGTARFGVGTLQSDLCPPTKLAWRDGIVWLNSDVLFGVINLSKQNGKFHFYNHYIDFEPHETHIFGPDIRLSVHTSHDDNCHKMRIVGSRMIYAGDLLSAMIWAESFKEGGGKGEYAVSCDNFQQPGMNARVYGKSGRVRATFYNQRSKLSVKRVKNNLRLYCSDLDVFKKLLGQFVVTAGRTWVDAIKYDKKWYGTIKIRDARIIEDCQSGLRGVRNDWSIDALWSFDGRALCIRGAHLRNNDARVLLNVRITGFKGCKRIVVAGSVYKRNRIARLSELLLSAKYTHKFFGSRFFVTGQSGRTKFALSRANVLLGWVSFLPV